MKLRFMQKKVRPNESATKGVRDSDDRPTADGGKTVEYSEEATDGGLVHVGTESSHGSYTSEVEVDDHAEVVEAPSIEKRMDSLETTVKMIFMMLSKKKKKKKKKIMGGNAAS